MASMFNIGEPAPEFHLKGIDGKIHSLADLRGFRGSVLIFTELENKYWHQYEDRIIALQQRVREQKIRFTAIYVSQEDDNYADVMRQMTSRAREKGYNFPIILDHLQDIIGDYGVKEIPEAFLLDKDLHLVYRGAIDDAWEDEAKVTRNYLNNAIEAMLDGREVSIKETEVEGDVIQWNEPHR